MNKKKYFKFCLLFCFEITHYVLVGSIFFGYRFYDLFYLLFDILYDYFNTYLNIKNKILSLFFLRL